MGIFSKAPDGLIFFVGKAPKFRLKYLIHFSISNSLRILLFLFNSKHRAANGDLVIICMSAELTAYSSVFDGIWQISQKTVNRLLYLHTVEERYDLFMFRIVTITQNAPSEQNFHFTPVS